MTQVTNTVRFVLDGEIMEAQGVRRTTTVLDYLRDDISAQVRKRVVPKGTAVPA